jgi:hypothetical protein
MFFDACQWPEEHALHNIADIPSDMNQITAFEGFGLETL